MCRSTATWLASRNFPKTLSFFEFALHLKQRSVSCPVLEQCHCFSLLSHMTHIRVNTEAWKHRQAPWIQLPLMPLSLAKWWRFPFLCDALVLQMRWMSFALILHFIASLLWRYAWSMRETSSWSDWLYALNMEKTLGWHVGKHRASCWLLELFTFGRVACHIPVPPDTGFKRSSVAYAHWRSHLVLPRSLRPTS